MLDASHLYYRHPGRAVDDARQEAIHQRALVKYMRERKWCFTAPCNGEFGTHAHLRRNAATKGMEKGVPDLCVFEARKGYHGLFIEMKAKNGTVRKEQKDFKARLLERGYLSVVAYEFTEALQWLDYYFDYAEEADSK